MPTVGSFLPLLLASRRRRSSSPTPPPSAVTLFQALRDRLLSINGISSVLTNIYKNLPGSGATYPYMVVSSISAADDVFNSEELWRKQEFQFSIISTDDIQADTVGQLAYQTLLPTNRTTRPPLRWQQGYEIVRWPLYNERLMQQPGRGPNNKNLWIYSFGYRIEWGIVPPEPS